MERKIQYVFQRGRGNVFYVQNVRAVDDFRSADMDKGFFWGNIFGIGKH